MWQAARLALGTASALGFARFAYGLLLPAMRDDLGWSLTDAGMMSTANGLGYLVGALVTARVVRRWGVTAAFRGGMVLTAMSLAATAVSDDFLMLLVTRAVAGVSGAVVFITGGVIASRVTVYFAGTGLGIVVSGVAIPLLGEHWRGAWVGLGVAAGVATLVSWTAARTDEAPRTAQGRARPLWRIAVAYLLFAAGYITYITFLSAYLSAQHAPTARVILTWTALGLAVMAAPALWSRPIATWPGTLTLLLGLLAVSAALAPVIVVSAIVYGATFMVVPAAVTALIKAHTEPADWTPTLAMFTTLFAAGQTAGPWLAGIIADHTSTDAALVWTAALCTAAAVTTALGLRKEVRL
jgi:predicted MFS family arabinose efflux permease